MGLSETASIRMIRHCSIFSILLALVTTVPSRSHGQDATTVTPELLSKNPFLLPISSAEKVATITQDSTSSVVIRARESLRRKKGATGMSYWRYQERTGPDGSVALDTVNFGVRGLEPLSRKSISQGDTLTLVFEEGGVTGTRRNSEGEEPVVFEYDGSFFDVNVLDYVCVALVSRFGPGLYRVPLYVDRTNTIEWYEILLGDLFPIEVDGEEVQAVEVAYKSPEGREGIVWVDPLRNKVVREEAHPAPGIDIVLDFIYE